MLVYSKSLGEKTGNLAVNQYQFGMLTMERNAALNHQGVNVMQEIADRLNAVNHLNGINAVRSPADLYKAFDQTVLRQFQPNTEFTLFNDLMPLSSIRPCMNTPSLAAACGLTPPCQARSARRWMLCSTSTTVLWFRCTIPASSSTGVSLA